MMRKLLAIGLMLLAAGVTSNTKAQDSVLTELYGQGVHAYFSNQHFEAFESLNKVIEQGSQDPRAYYFRGLAKMRLGMQEDVKSDFDMGAMLEVKSADRIYPIGASLQRVQGCDRLSLEKHRTSARLAARSELNKAKAARYEQLQRAEGQVLRDPNRTPDVQPRTVGEPPAADPTDPFADDAEPTPTPAPTPAQPTTPMPAESTPAQPSNTPEPAPADDPFGADQPADDPFGADAPADSPADSPAPADDPFGTDAPADDPFGADAPADSPPAPADDPFGG
jgi:hypothetical protein